MEKVVWRIFAQKVDKRSAWALSEPGAVATGQRFTLGIVVGSVALSLGPVATTTPRGLPARGPRSAPGSDKVTHFLCKLRGGGK